MHALFALSESEGLLDLFEWISMRYQIIHLYRSVCYHVQRQSVVLRQGAVGSGYGQLAVMDDIAVKGDVLVSRSEAAEEVDPSPFVGQFQCLHLGSHR